MSKLCLESVENRETTEIDNRLDILFNMLLGSSTGDNATLIVQGVYVYKRIISIKLSLLLD